MFMIASIIQNSAVVVALHLCGNPLEISMETKHFAAALSLFYKGVPESLIRSMLFHLSKATRNVSLDLVFFQYILNLENFVIKYF